MNDFLSVITLSAFLYAVASGILLGACFVPLTLRRPPLTYLTPSRAIALSVFVLIVLGTVFFAGQFTQSVLEGKNPIEPPRILGRYALWCMFSIAIAVSHQFALGFALPFSKSEPSALVKMERRLNIRADARELRTADKVTTDDIDKKVTDIQDKVKS